MQVLLGNGFGDGSPDVWTDRGIAGWKNRAGLVTLKIGSMERFLGDCEAGSLGLVSLSNLHDVLDEENWRELLESALKALAPGGYVVVRSMLVDGLSGGVENFVNVQIPEGDWSPLCPVIWVGRK